MSYYDQIKALSESDRNKVWCDLNRFRWPRCLVPIPENWDTQSDKEKHKNPQACEAWLCACELTTEEGRTKEWFLEVHKATLEGGNQ